MKLDSKKLTASVLTVAMMASFAGCSLLGSGKAKQAVLEAADSYASNICSLKASKVTKAVSGVDEDRASALELAFSTISGDAVLSAIADTLTYTVDEESVEVDTKKGEGSVTVTFTYVDADAVYADVIDDGGDQDAFIAALADSDEKVEVEVDFDFVLEDEEWLVDDSKLSKLEDIFAFVDSEYSFTPALSADLVSDSSCWYYTDTENHYTAPSSIEYDIIPVDDAQEIEWNFYYEFYYNGSLVYTSENMTDSGYFIEAYYGTSYDGATVVDGCLAPGSYRCVMYTLDGAVLADATCTVEAAATTPVSTGSGNIADLWSAGINAYWYSYSDGTGYAIDTPNYSTSETVIEYTCQVNDEDTFANLPIYYEVYYSSTGNTSDAELVFSDTIYPKEYTNGYFYEFQYNGTLEEGSYFFVGAEDANADTALFIAEATVS